jgi:hypothetical protein
MSITIYSTKYFSNFFVGPISFNLLIRKHGPTNTKSENMFHVLFHCPRAKRAWPFCLDHSTNLSKYGNLSIWLRDFSTNYGPICPIIIWKIRCSCNKCICKYIKHVVQNIGDKVFFLLHHVLKAFVSPNPHHDQPSAYVVS